MYSELGVDEDLEQEAEAVASPVVGAYRETRRQRTAPVPQKSTLEVIADQSENIIKHATDKATEVLGPLVKDLIGQAVAGHLPEGLEDLIESTKARIAVTPGVSPDRRGVFVLLELGDGESWYMADGGRIG